MEKSNQSGRRAQAAKRTRSSSPPAALGSATGGSHCGSPPSVSAARVSTALAANTTRLSLGCAPPPLAVGRYVRSSLDDELAAAVRTEHLRIEQVASVVESTLQEGIMGSGLLSLLVPHAVIPIIVSQHVVLPWWHRTEKDMRVSWKSWELVSYLSITHPAVVQLMPSSVFRTVQALAIRCAVLPASDHVFEAVVDFKFIAEPECLGAWLRRVPGATTASVACFFDAAAVEAVAQATELRSLTFDHRASSKAAASVEPLAGLSRLESLSLLQFDLSATTAVCLHSLPLRTLDLCSCAVTSAFVAAIATVTLCSLKLSNCGVTDERMEALSTHPALTSLDVSYNGGMTDESLRYIARLPQLSRLDVSLCAAVTDTGVGFLADAPKICSLSLACITALGSGLVPQLARMPALREVDLSHTGTDLGTARRVLRGVTVHPCE